MATVDRRRPPRAPSPSAVSPLRRVTSVPLKSASKLRPPSVRSRSPGGATTALNSDGFASAEGRRRSSLTGHGSPAIGMSASRPRARSFSPPDAAFVARPLTGSRAASGLPRPRSISPAACDQASREPLSRQGSRGGALRKSSVQVAVRCRPMSEREQLEGETPAVVVNGHTVTVSGGPLHHNYGTSEPKDDSHMFAYDHAFGPEADQSSLYSACGAPLVKELCAASTACALASQAFDATRAEDVRRSLARCA